MKSSKENFSLLLKKYFGYDTFRPLQEEIISNVADRKDTLVIMPTGGGKSLCYQLPAIQLEGVTLVVSPLIALMKDQVDALKANGIAAEFINSSLSLESMLAIQKMVQNGKVKILYVAPERLAVEAFQGFLKTIKLQLIAIDEAHCISEWGHDFRPEYRNLRKLRELFLDVPIIALTATATQKVQRDIIDQLALQKAKIFSRSFNRENLTYLIQPKNGVFDQLKTLLEKHRNESVIIYCSSRKATEELAEDLRDEKFQARPYHAGLDQETRTLTQEKFIRDEISIIVATIAFGMGIDKPDVRLVVHYDIPKSLEGYYQETGRAGRDSLPSECVLFYSYGDKMKQDYFIRQISKEAERMMAEQKLDQVIEFCELQHCRREYLLKYFGENWSKENCGSCDFCLNPIEEFDATDITYKILSTILRTGEHFGIIHIIDILMGKKNKKIEMQNHHLLPVFGIEKKISKEEIRHVIHVLISRNFLMKNSGQYPTIKVSSNGKELLKYRQKIYLPKQKSDPAPPTEKNKKEQEFDLHLFEELRKLRKRIADEKNVPSFIIFSDVSLHEMAYYYPKSLESFQNISGVGAMKLAHFGKQFLEVIEVYAEKNGKEEKPIPSRQKNKNKT